MFNATKKCHFCDYSYDLMKTPSGYMACTTNECWKYSCYNKYELRENSNLILDTDPYSEKDYDKMTSNNCITCFKCGDVIDTEDIKIFEFVNHKCYDQVTESIKKNS